MAEITIVAGRDDLTHVVLAGRLDVPGVQSVEQRFSLFAAARRRPTIVDLTAVDLLASSGIGMIVALARGLKLHGVPLVVIASEGPIDRVLRATSIDAVVPIVGTLDEAYALVAPPT